MRKYVLSGAVVSAVFGGLSIIRATREGPRDWRLILMWVSWALSVAIAVGSVMQRDTEASTER
jgi:hypothetical protein